MQYIRVVIMIIITIIMVMAEMSVSDASVEQESIQSWNIVSEFYFVTDRHSIKLKAC